MANNRKLIGKEIHLKKRPAGFVTEDDFELVDVDIPEIKKEGDFLVRNIWRHVIKLLSECMKQIRISFVF